jgi:hypothetical protein
MEAAQAHSVLVAYVPQASGACIIAALIIGLIVRIRSKTPATRTLVEEAGTELLRAIAAGAVPSAVVLIIAGIRPSIIPDLTALNVPIAAAGVALLIVSVRTALKPS